MSPVKPCPAQQAGCDLPSNDGLEIKSSGQRIMVRYDYTHRNRGWKRAR